MTTYNDNFLENEDFNEQLKKEEAYIRAKERLDKLVGFYWHLAVYIIVNIVIMSVITIYSGLSFWSFGVWATAIFWGIGLLFHFLAVFGPNFIFGKNWEQKKIQEFIEKEQENQRKFE